MFCFLYASHAPYEYLAPSFTRRVSYRNNRNSRYTREICSVQFSPRERALINEKFVARSRLRKVSASIEKLISVFSTEYVACLKMEITHDVEPDFSNARTLQFHELIERKDEDARSSRNGIFDAVYKATTVKG